MIKIQLLLTILKESDEKMMEDQKKSKNLEFLELNLIYGHKCRKTIFKSNLFKVGTDEYRACVLNKGNNKKN